MNQSIETVRNNSINPIAKTFAQFLIDNEGHRFIATFEKVNREIRTMLFVPRNQYNRLMGIESTTWGREMVKTKALNDMITVVEILDSNTVQPRTINLGKLITLKVA